MNSFKSTTQACTCVCTGEGGWRGEKEKERQSGAGPSVTRGLSHNQDSLTEEEQGPDGQ